MSTTLIYVVVAVMVAVIGIYVIWISPLLAKQNSIPNNNSQYQNQHAAAGAGGAFGFGGDGGAGVSGACSDGGGGSC